MEKELLDALQRAILAGGKKLKPAQLTELPKKAQDAFLNRLIEVGHLEQEGKAYHVTDAGRQAWEEAADPAVVAAWHEERLVAFLQLVAAKKGKPLADKDKAGVSEKTRSDAQDRKLVQPGSKPDAYDLLPAGKLLLLADRPIEEQADELRRLTADLQERFDGLSKAAAKQLRSLLGDEGTSLAEATRRRMDEVLTTLQTELEKLKAIPEAARIGREAQERVEKIAAETTAHLAQAEKLEGLIRQTQQGLETQRSEQAAFEAALKPYFARLEKLAAERPTAEEEEEPEPEPAAKKPAEPSDEELWEATRTAHAELSKEGTVKIPELTDAVRKGFPDVSAEGYHRLLQEWHGMRKLVLEAANSPNAELRAKEGISSARGLLFYVHLN